MFIKVLAVLLHHNKPLILAHSMNALGYDWLRMPGGGVEAGESLQEAVLRELWEESGIAQAKVVRKVGVLNYISTMDGLPRERHCYLLKTNQPLPNQWDHLVSGDGEDAQDLFSHFWIGVEDFGRIDPTLQPILTPKLIPELYINPRIESPSMLD